jgi:hypothetical protein
MRIGEKTSHIPFRDSKLTYLLQDCLSGDGKTLMIVNLSPTVSSAPESLCSLRFASDVNKVELGKPVKVVKNSINKEEGEGEDRSRSTTRLLPPKAPSTRSHSSGR